MIKSLKQLSKKKPGGEKSQGDFISVYKHVRRGMKGSELSFPQGFSDKGHKLEYMKLFECKKCGFFVVRVIKH